MIREAPYVQEGESSLVQNTFKIKLSPHNIRTVRIPYSFIDWLAEVGGFAIAMYFIFKVLTSLLLANELTLYLV